MIENTKIGANHVNASIVDETIFTVNSMVFYNRI